MSDVVAPGLPVMVIGAGPQGLAAAAHLVERGEPVVVLEAGTVRPPRWRSGAMCGCSRPGPSWSTRRPGGCSSRRAGRRRRRVIRRVGTGSSAYLAPLAAALGDRVRYGMRVVGVSRRGRDRLVSAGRAEQPFTVHVRQRRGGVAVGRPGGDRRLGHLDPAEPGRCGRLPGAGRAGGGGERNPQLPAPGPGAGRRPSRPAHGRGR